MQEQMEQAQGSSPEEMQQMQQQIMAEMQNLIAVRQSQLIAEYIEDMDEMLNVTQDDPLVELKQKELDIRSEENERKEKEAAESLRKQELFETIIIYSGVGIGLLVLVGISVVVILGKQGRL